MDAVARLDVERIGDWWTPSGRRDGADPPGFLRLPWWLAELAALGAGTQAAAAGLTARTTVADSAMVTELFRVHGTSLVRMARLFVDDRNAAEDLVQEAFIRMSRAAHRVEDPAKAAAYLRSIVLNLCRDHNRRGLVSLRHHLPLDDAVASSEDEVVVRDDQRAVIDAVRALPARQRDCVVLRYFFDLGVAEVATTLGISENSVKTHLKRALAALRAELGDEESEP
jgi:RNA polymerase sigma-70 factor (sigma-E family)